MGHQRNVLVEFGKNWQIIYSCCLKRIVVKQHKVHLPLSDHFKTHMFILCHRILKLTGKTFFNAFLMKKFVKMHLL